MSLTLSPTKPFTKKVICLMGPTATGKTETAIFLADRLPLSIISVDSALVYQGMDIGTAKPSKNTLQNYPHALVDIITPLERYSAAHFRKDARTAIEIAFENKKIPLLVGGTFLYFRALLEGISPIPATPLDLQTQLTNELKAVGAETLHTRLKSIDPESAARIKPQDHQRIIRALAVYEASGKTLSYFWQLPKKEPLPYPYLKIALQNPLTEERNQQIAKRYQQMIHAGLVTEVQTLIKRYPALSLDDPSMRAVGYRQIFSYLQGELSLDEAIQQAIIATRQYAKRQRTWLRQEKNLQTVSITDKDFKAKVLAKIESFLADS